jgi:hypothetical protein
MKYNKFSTVSLDLKLNYKSAKAVNFIEFLATVSIGNVLNLKYCRPSLFGDVAMAPPIEVFQLTRDFQVVYLFIFAQNHCYNLPAYFALLFGPKIILKLLAIFIP